MFKTLVQTIFPSVGKDQGFTPDYLTFERSRDPINLHEEEFPRTQASAPVIQFKSTPFLDFLFGDTERSSSEDPLSVFVTEKIKQLLQQPGRLLADLPVMPTSVSKVIALLNDQSFNLDDLLSVIEQEPSMAADMIKLANSTKYKRGDKQVTDLQKAFMCMGANGLKEGVLEVFLKKFTASSNVYFKQFGEKIWQHGFNSAQYAQALAMQKFDIREASIVYVVALLRNLGAMVIFQLMTEAFKYVDPDAQPNSASFKMLMAEQALTLTITIAKHWQLPESIVDMLEAQEPATGQEVLAANCVVDALIISEAKLLYDASRFSLEEFTNYLKKHKIDDGAMQFALSLAEQELSLAK